MKSKKLAKRIIAMIFAFAMAVSEFGTAAYASDEGTLLQTEKITADENAEVSLSEDPVNDETETLSGDVIIDEKGETEGTLTLSGDIVVADNDELGGQTDEAVEVSISENSAGFSADAADDNEEYNEVSDELANCEAEPEGAGEFVKLKNNTALSNGWLNDAPSVIKNEAWNGDIVYFGKYQGKSVGYRVLRKATTNFSKDSKKTIWIDCDNVLFNDHMTDQDKAVSADSNWQENGYLYELLNGESFMDNFSKAEKDAIAQSYKSALSTNEHTDDIAIADRINAKFCKLDGEKIFPLDAHELSSLIYGYWKDAKAAPNRTKKMLETGKQADYWTRSYGNNGEIGAYVGTGGSINGVLFLNPKDPAKAKHGVSPSMNISLSDVIFTSKVSNRGRKMTLWDKDMKMNYTGKAEYTDEGVRIPYSITAENGSVPDAVTVLILDKKYSENGAVIKYYGRLDTGSSFSLEGSGTFAFPDDLDPDRWGKDYRVYILAEDINGATESDYASQPIEITTLNNPKYNLWVDGEQVSAANKNKLCGGKAVFDSAENTLTFRDWTKDNFDDLVPVGDKKAVIYSRLESLKLIGKATASGTDYGVYSTGDVDIEGSFNLTADVCGIKAGKLTVKDGRSFATTRKSSTKAIDVGTINVSGGFLQAATEGDQAICINAGTCNVEKTARLITTASGSDSTGIAAELIHIYDKCEISVLSSGSNGYGIEIKESDNPFAGAFSINGCSKIDIFGKTVAIKGDKIKAFSKVDSLEYLSPEGGKYDETKKTVVDLDGNPATEVRIRPGDYTVDFVTEHYGVVEYKDANKRYEATYNGSGIRPKVEVKKHGSELVEGRDYTISYKNNVNVDKKGKPAKVKVKFKGRFSGSKTLDFYIMPRTIQQDYLAGSVAVQPGKKVNPVLYYNGRKLTSKDYRIVSKTGSLKFKLTDKEEDRKITIYGKGNFAGSFEVPVNLLTTGEIKAKTIKVGMSKKLKLVYNGDEQFLTAAQLKVTDAAGNPLTNDVNYTVTYSRKPVDAGKVKVVISGKGNYIGSAVRTFTILPDKDKAVTDVTASSSVQYVKGGTRPTITVNAALPGKEAVKLTEGKDYKISCKGNTKVTVNAKYKITYKGNYKGRKTVNGTFTITPAEFDVSLVKAYAFDMVYKKKGKYMSAPFVAYGANNVLLGKKDYTVSYLAEVSEGAYVDITGKKFTLTGNEVSVKVILKGKGNYANNTVEIPDCYVIKKVSKGALDLSKAKITKYGEIKKKIPDQTYTGASIEPSWSCYLKQGKSWKDLYALGLSQEKDYDVRYFNNTDCGKAIIFIKAKNTTDQKIVKGKVVKFRIRSRGLSSIKFIKR